MITFYALEVRISSSMEDGREVAEADSQPQDDATVAESDSGGEADADARSIVLVTPDMQVTCSKWDVLVQVPICHALKPDTFVANTKVGDVFAFRDINSVTQTVWREVFVLRAAECVHVFDKDGCPINEPEEYVDNGRQDLHDQDNGFLADWRLGFYKLAQLVQLQPDEKQTEASTEVEHSAFDSMLAVNQRIAMAYAVGDAVLWYAGFVAEVDSSTAARLVAFDDGDLATFSKEQLMKEESSGMLKAFDAKEGGMVANQTGLPMAARVAYNKVGKPKGNGDAVGVLIGASERSVAGQTVYEAFVASEPALQAAALRSRATKSIRTRDERDLLSDDDRIASWTNDRGFHTFRRKDVVRFINPRGNPEEPKSEAFVVGVLFAEKQVDMQGRKCLILAERAEATHAFFPGRFQEWQRCTKTDDGDPRNSEQVRQIDDGEAEKVAAAFLNTNAFDSMNTLEKMYNAAAKGPPSLVVWRELEKKKEPMNKRKTRDKMPRRDAAPSGTKLGGKGRADDTGPPADSCKNKRNRRTAAQLAADRARETREKEKKQRELEAARVAEVNATHAKELDALKKENLRMAEALLKQRPVLPAPAASGLAAAPIGPPGPAGALPTTLPLTTILPGAAQEAPPTSFSAGEQANLPQGADGVGISSLPAGWRYIPAHQSATGVAYYMNRSLNVTQYHHPTGASPPLPPPPGPAPTERSLMSPIPITISAASTATAVQGTSAAQVSQRSSPSEVSMRIARLRAQLAHETNPSIKAYIAGELAATEAMLLQPSLLSP